MLTWNQELNVFEVAAIARGVDINGDLLGWAREDRLGLYVPREQYDETVQFLIEDHLEEETKIIDPDKLHNDPYHLIVNALSEEITLIDPKRTDIDKKALEDTCLVIVTRSEDENGNIFPLETTITRKSAAQWFRIRGQEEMAERLMNFDVEPAIPSSSQTQRQTQRQTKPPRTKEEGLLNTIGIMAYMLAQKTPRYKDKGIHNRRQIALAVQEMADDLGIGRGGLSNLERDIPKELESAWLNKEKKNK